jgi:Fe-S cluster biogenesis protein NfuA/nitrite reductase/ring-hydroxylating ferredoxin subunit
MNSIHGDKTFVAGERQTEERRSPGGSDSDINVHGERVRRLLEQIEALPYPAAKELIHECTEALLAFYGRGLNRILQIIDQAGPDGYKVYRDLLNDDVINGLLLIHDLHPMGLEARLLAALDKVRPYLQSHGGNVELVSLQNDIAKLRLQGTCRGCASSSITLELAIRHAIEQACPDLAHFEVEGVVETDGSRQVSPFTPRTATDWIVIEDAPRLAEGEWMPVRAGEMRLVICRLNETFYAYRNRCPTCNMPFDTGRLDTSFLSCASGHRYDVVHAGGCLEIPGVHLDPLPLLVQESVVKVALAPWKTAN